MRKAFKYRLWTDANQERELATALESHRRLYNVCLDYRELAYQCFGASVTYCDCSRWFKHQRDTNPFFARLNFSSAQATVRRLDKAFVAFFRRRQAGEKPGYPRFKGKDHFNSIEFPSHGDGVRLRGDRLRVQHVGTIRVKLHRPAEGKIKTVTLKREADKWYVVLSCELPDVPLADNGRPPVGIDVGPESFLTTSEGEQEPNPRYLKAALPKLRRASRAAARKKRGGKNRRKAVKRLARIHTRVRNLRREHHHQVALKLVRRYSLIAVESLNVRGMLRNDRLGRAISDAGWSSFVGILRGKAESAGVQVVAVDPRGSSQQCVCGQEVRKDLSARWHDCPRCGLSQHRDHVSARIILARGLAWTKPVQVNVSSKAKRPARSRRVHATE